MSFHQQKCKIELLVLNITLLIIISFWNREVLDFQEQSELNSAYLAFITGLSWVLGNAEELPFDDDKFDVYTIAFGIRNVTRIDLVSCWSVS